MSLEPWALGLALIANLVIGIGLVVSVYRLMEQRFVLGAVGGLILGVIIVYAQATVGQQLFDLTFSEKRLIVVVAGIGASLGITGTMITFRPEI